MSCDLWSVSELFYLVRFYGTLGIEEVTDIIGDQN